MRRLAVVNDDRTFIELVSELLHEHGWDCISLHEGNAAFETIKREQPDAVILDIRMEQPDTGWRVLNLLMLDPATGVSLSSCARPTGTNCGPRRGG